MNKSFLRVFWIGFLALLLANPIRAEEAGDKTTLLIESNPPGAKIQLDYRNIGTTPHAIENIKPGSHFLTLIMYGYHRMERHITVKTGEKNKIYEKLMALVGILTLKSKPSGASVIMDGSVFLGQTPIVKPNTPIGQHTLLFTLPGYKDITRKFRLKYGDEKKFVITLPRLPGKLSVFTNPPGAYIYLNGKNEGRSNKTFELLGKLYNLEIKKSGYKTITRKLSLSPGKTINLDLDLEDSFQTRLSIKTKPSGVNIFLDGENIGKTPHMVKKIEPGVHTLGLSKKGYQDVNKRIFVKKDETTRIFESMKLQVGSISISATPRNSTIYLDGTYRGVTPKSIASIPAGEHKLRIVHSKYKDYEEKFLLQNDEYKTVDIKLQPLPGKLDLDATQKGASIYVDGKKKGTTPTVLLVIPGSHILQIHMPGYRKHQQTVDLDPGETLKIYAPLEKIRVGVVQVISEPPGAQVFIDSQPAGKTPLTVSPVEMGEHNILLSLLGYETTTTKVRVEDEETLELRVKLKIKSGTLTLNIIPSRAKVEIDNVFAGYTPLDVDVPEGSHILKLSKDDYQTWETTFVINYKEKKEIRHNLEPIPGILKVNSEPRGVDFSINDEPRGQTPKSINLKPGRYTVRVSLEGYRPQKKVVKLGLNEKINLFFELDEILQGALLVSTVPPGAKIYLNGKEKGVSPANFTDILADKYLVRIVKEGFKPIEKLVTVYKNQSAEILEELAPQTGSLYVKIFPPKAEIFLDNKHLGPSPQYIRNLVIGKHEVRITHEDYADWFEEVTIITDRQNRINLNLKKLPGEVFIFSSPSGGDIYVNDKFKGKTNTLIKLNPGNYKIRVTKPGYYDYFKDVNIPSGRQISLDYHLLEQGTGNLMVTTSQPGAQVFLNGEFIGQTPLEKKYIMASSHSLLVIKDGYKSITENFTITKGENFELDFKLVSVWGILKIFTEPKQSLIYLDGKYLGRGPGIFKNIQVGPHRIRITHRNFRDWTGEFNLKADEEKTIRIKLEPLHANLSIHSNPSASYVYIKGEKVGKTPLKLPLIPGSYSIRLEKEGYLGKNISVELLPGATKKFEETLTKKKVLRIKRLDLAITKIPVERVVVKKKSLNLPLNKSPVFPSVPKRVPVDLS